MKWFSFFDMHSGGDVKTNREVWLVLAPDRTKAERLFEEKTGCDPYNVTCDCCGEDFSVTDRDWPTDATDQAVVDEYNRGRTYKDNSIGILRW